MRGVEVEDIRGKRVLNIIFIELYYTPCSIERYSFHKIARIIRQIVKLGPISLTA